MKRLRTYNGYIARSGLGLDPILTIFPLLQHNTPFNYNTLILTLEAAQIELQNQENILIFNTRIKVLRPTGLPANSCYHFPLGV